MVRHRVVAGARPGSVSRRRRVRHPRGGLSGQAYRGHVEIQREEVAGKRRRNARDERRTDAPLNHDQVVSLFLDVQLSRLSLRRPRGLFPPHLSKQLDRSLGGVDRFARTSRIEMLQPCLPDPDRFPFPGRRSFSEARPAVFARSESVLLCLFDEGRDGFDEVDQVEQGQEDSRGDAADAGAAVEGAERSCGTTRGGGGRSCVVRWRDGREVREEREDQQAGRGCVEARDRRAPAGGQACQGQSEGSRDATGTGATCSP